MNPTGIGTPLSDFRHWAIIHYTTGASMLTAPAISKRFPRLGHLLHWQNENRFFNAIWPEVRLSKPSLNNNWMSLMTSEVQDSLIFLKIIYLLLIVLHDKKRVCYTPFLCVLEDIFYWFDQIELHSSVCWEYLITIGNMQQFICCIIVSSYVLFFSVEMIHIVC